MPYDPGPIVIESLPLAPRIVQSNEFTGLGAQLVTALGGSDLALRGAAATIAPLAGRSLEDDYSRDVAPASVGLEQLQTPADGAELLGIVGALDSVLVDVATQASDLPAPNQEGPDSDTGSTPDPGDLPGAGQD